MATLEDIGTYLGAQVGSLTLGTNLFLGRLPDEPDTCVALYETGGAEPLPVMGSDAVPPIEQPRVQVLTRASSYSSARSLADLIFRALEQILNENLSGTRYHRCAAVQSPFALERDSHDRVILAQNFQVQKTL